MRISGIYCIICLINGKYYIGSSNNIIKREKDHFRLLDNNQHHCDYLQNSYNLYKKESFIFFILEQNIQENKLIKLEQEYIDNNKDYLFNSSLIAGKCEMTQEVKYKISKANSGENHGMFGKRGFWSGKNRSKETKNKISRFWKQQYQDGYINNNKGKPMSQEQKLKVSQGRKGKCLGKENGFFGKKHSEENKSNWSKAKIGKYSGDKHPMFDNKIYNFQNIITKEIFIGTQFDFRTKFNISSSLLSQLIKGKSKTCKKWIILKTQDTSEPMALNAISKLV